MSKSLVIRADASRAMGSGHVMRCLALAQGARDAGYHVVFLMEEGEGIEERVKREGFEIAFITKKKDAQETIDTAKTHHAIWVVVDGYQFDSAYQKKIKDAGFKLLFIDDYGHCDHYDADIVLNQNVYASEDLYASREPYTKLLLGTQYVLLRAEFSTPPLREGKGSGQNTLITLGGFSQKKLSSKIQQSLQKDHLEVRVASGDADMPSLMQWADIAVSAGGTTTYELAYMGVPAVLLVRADNQKAVAEGMVKAGCAVNLGNVEDVKIEEIMREVDALLSDVERRKQMSDAGRKIVDGNGVFRLLDALKSFS